MSYLVSHPWDKYGRPPTPGEPYDEPVADAIERIEAAAACSPSWIIDKLLRELYLDKATESVVRKLLMAVG